MPRWALLSGLSMLFTFQPAMGQRIAPGQRARVTLSDSSTRVGVIDSVSPDEVWLRPELQPAGPVPLDRVHRVELWRDRKPEIGRGIAYGALAGAVLGGALWLAFINGDEFEEMKGMWAAVFLGTGAAGGAVAGAGLSLMLARDKWVAVPREQWAVARTVWHLGLRFSP
jgi:hypothetical protein